ncbi:cytochrome C [Advenella sp. S44]|uniref:c-type cytochrome n=1 Tax=Advenella sp. S44 TaxID=1982755 RepID=UPI000C2A5365|nr:c-type cytochrome [Advenella sp. S44]PJX26097.1 cytochrome C [Advenella sp. S44]
MFTLNNVRALTVGISLFVAQASIAQPIDISALTSTPEEQAQIEATIKKMAEQKLTFQNVGRDALKVEVQAWDIDVRPDFQGLKPGKGSVADGEDVWASKCASCHGDFGESNKFFAPLLGGTTEDDVKAGRVSNLRAEANVPSTTMMKISTVSTLWDFIYRAMPWNAPKSLTPDETYAVVAYLLSEASVVDPDFELTDSNIADVQKRMPNRDGMVVYPGLWHAKGKADTQNTDCMQDCAGQAKVVSALPEHARNMNGNYAAQMRIVGAAIGVNSDAPKLTGKPEDNAVAVRTFAKQTVNDNAKNVDVKSDDDASEDDAKASDTSMDAATQEKVKTILSTNACTSCHAATTKLVGPSFKEISEKYSENDAAKLGEKIRNGGAGVWGAIPMPPQPGIAEGDISLVTKWILSAEHD